MSTEHNNERLIDVFGTHWIRYVPHILVYLLITSVSLLLFVLAGVAAHHGMWTSHIALLFGLCLMLMAHHWFFHRVLSESLIEVIVTDKRIISLQDSILFTNDMQEIFLSKIKSVEAHEHGILQNTLRYGSLWFDISGSGRGSHVIIQYVPHPHTKARLIMQLLAMR